MRGHGTSVAVAVLAVTAVVVLAIASSASGRQAASITVIADKLNNPRGVTVNRAGAVLVAEAGKAGTSCFAKDTCLGLTGAITRWNNGRTVRLVTGLPSIGGADGSFAVGAGGVAVDPTGALYIAMTDAPECKLPPGLPSNVVGTLGKIVRWGSRTGVSRAADISGAECANNYDRGDRNSNPYGLATTGPGRMVVVDAGANALFEVDGGTVQLLAVFPRTARGSQSVPTSVAVGPDGNYYVGEFVGEPRRGKPRRWEARIWKVVRGERPTVHLRGFNAVTGLAFAADGTLFVTEWSINPASRQEARGDVVKVAPDGKRTRIGFGELHFPSGAALGPGGELYVSNWSILGDTPAASGPFAGKTGELVRITAP